ncbi:MAG: GNAT family N-acetyltransferase, partial [Actinomycetia bacterium]|nr:GNAT family N-acetyltransferase [Actinomycetes bacterium]
MALPQLDSERLTLRAWDPDKPADVVAAFDIYRRDEVSRWLGAHPAPWTSEQAAHARLLRWQSAGFDAPGYGVWAVVPAAHRDPVGSVLLGHLPDAEGTQTDDIEIGWHLHPDHWGQGYA